MTLEDAPEASYDVRFEKSGLARGREALRRFTRATLPRIADLAGHGGGDVSVLFCSEDAIRKLNRDFRQIDKATDILSFPAEERHYLGDLAICLIPTARDAAEEGQTLAERVPLLLVHGVLHLIGLDHDSDSTEAAMWAEQDRILAALNPLTLPEISLFHD